VAARQDPRRGLREGRAPVPGRGTGGVGGPAPAGRVRRGAREYRRYLDTARSSLDEVEAILEIAKELGYVELSTFARLEARRDEAAKTLYGLLRAISRSVTTSAK